MVDEVNGAQIDRNLQGQDMTGQNLNQENNAKPEDPGINNLGENVEESDHTDEDEAELDNELKIKMFMLLAVLIMTLIAFAFSEKVTYDGRLPKNLVPEGFKLENPDD